MWLKDSNQKLEGPILRDKLKLDVESVQCAVDARGWLIARIKTKAKRRSNEILKILMGEEAFKAIKQPAAMNIPVLDYNQCVPSDGHKIRGADGITILANSKDTKNDFKNYSDMINGIMNGTVAGKYLGEWKYTDHIPEKDSNQWAEDDAVQQQAMNEDPSAFGINESDEEEEPTRKQKRSADIPMTQQAKRAHTDSSLSALAFADKFMQSIADNRKESADNANLRVKMAEMTHAAEVKELTEKLQAAATEIATRIQQAENVRSEMQASHTNVVQDLTKKFHEKLENTEKEHATVVKDLTTKLEQSEGLLRKSEETTNESMKQQNEVEILLQTKIHQAEKTIANLSHTAKEIELQRESFSATKGKVVDVIESVLKDLEVIRNELVSTHTELDQTKRALDKANILHEHAAERLKYCESYLAHYQRKYDAPEWKHMEAHLQQLELENRTLRTVIKTPIVKNLEEKLQKSEDLRRELEQKLQQSDDLRREMEANHEKAIQELKKETARKLGVESVISLCQICQTTAYWSGSYVSSSCLLCRM